MFKTWACPTLTGWGRCAPKLEKQPHLNSPEKRFGEVATWAAHPPLTLCVVESGAASSVWRKVVSDVVVFLSRCPIDLCVCWLAGFVCELLFLVGARVCAFAFVSCSFSFLQAPETILSQPLQHGLSWSAWQLGIVPCALKT